MDQQQIRVKVSLRTKLVASIVLLLFVIIAFLNVATIVILRKDKVAYTYDSQSTEAVLAGNEFSTSVRHSLDTLRAALASVDPLKPPNPQDFQLLQRMIDSQSEVSSIAIELLNLSTGELSPALEMASRADDLKRLQLTPQDLVVPAEKLKPLTAELLKNSYALVNLAKTGGSPVLGVLFADTKLKDNPTGVPISLGIVSLESLTKDLSGKNITIASRSGAVLFDTDPTVYYGNKSVADDGLFQLASTSKLTLGAGEYETGGQKYLGTYNIPNGPEAIVLSKTEWTKAMKSTYQLTEKFILLGGMAIGFGVIFSIFFAKSITAPLMRLFRGTKEVSQGNFDLKLEETSGDEIGALTESFNVMAGKIRELVLQSMEKVRLENELAIASTVQQTLLPGPLYDNESVFIRSHYQSASECGGDWWGFFHNGNKLSLMIADATGHGLPSALITASARSCFSVLAKLAKEDPEFSYSPAAMLSYANKTVWDASEGKIMMTFFIGVIDFDDMTLTYASAGHNPPWLFKKEGDRFTLKSLTSIGHRLGETESLDDAEEKTVPVSKEDILFLYTDGLMEGKDLQGEMYGKKRTRKVVEASLAGGPDLIIQSLVDDYRKHNEGKALDDDITLAAAKIISLAGVKVGNA